ncbi:hypothetical protein EB001_12335 [bacterium]|nr:hypothetical protein [bacterium]
MRYPLYNKYAMPVDPRVLEQEDFEFEGSDKIKSLVSKLKKIEGMQDFDWYQEEIEEELRELWFYVDVKKGINLRDREKLLPVFKQLSRIFKVNEVISTTAYRGITLPRPYSNQLSDAFDTEMHGEWFSLAQFPSNKELIESLAYGLRSWSWYYSNAEGWAGANVNYQDSYSYPDSIIFSYKSPKIVFDCNSYLKEYPFRKHKSPFDPNEVLIYLKNPKAIKAKMLDDRKWLVQIK